jgi:glycosyltransferase involved in cell wall biosynthesis
MTARPAVSVIIPTFHREQEVVRAVRSVLEEPLPSLELFVIDDSPERSARDGIRSLDDTRVTYLEMDPCSRGRPALVRNWGIERASGDVLYFLDDDDTVVPGGLAALVDALRASPKVGMAFGRVQPFGPNPDIVRHYVRYFEWAARNARRLRWSSWLTSGAIMFSGTLIINSACAIRRPLAIELGGYDTNMAVYEDVEFFTRAMRRGGHVFVDYPVLNYATGRPSLIHDLDGDVSEIAASNKLAHRKLREAHPIEYRLLQVISKSLPLGTYA